MPKRKTLAPNARRQAAAAVNGVLDGASISASVSSLRPLLSAADLRLFRQLTSGTVRWLSFLDAVIEQAAARPMSKIDSGLRCHLRVAVYQLLFLGRVPARAAVFEAVEAAKQESGVSASRFVNGVLRAVARHPERDRWQLETDDPIADLAINQSHPEFLVRAWVKQFGWRETEALLAVNNQPKGSLSVASGRLEQLAEKLQAAGAEVEKSTVSPIGLLVSGVSAQDVVVAGGYVQDQASQAAALVPLPRPGERVFDAAASPGGKSLALTAFESEVKIVAADRKLRRLQRLSINLGRNADIVLADALHPGMLDSAFDRVVFDAPCSGSGTLRKHPELKWRISLSEIERLSEVQLAGLNSLADLVAPGGRLCYITCSIEWQENQQVIERFLANKSGWELESLDQPQTLVTSMQRFVRAPGCWQILPANDHDGATVHVLRRASE